MAVHIRLMRTGKKNAPTYRIVATDARRPRESEVLEIIGHYNPRREPPEIKVYFDRLERWLSRGAQITKRVKAILRKARSLEQAEASEAS